MSNALAELAFERLVDMGGSISFDELRYQLHKTSIGFDDVDLVDALYCLENAGKVTPTHWRATESTS